VLSIPAVAIAKISATGNPLPSYMTTVNGPCLDLLSYACVSQQTLQHANARTFYPITIISAL
jgi:hypothetical protein